MTTTSETGRAKLWAEQTEPFCVMAQAVSWRSWTQTATRGRGRAILSVKGIYGFFNLAKTSRRNEKLQRFCRWSFGDGIIMPTNYFRESLTSYEDISNRLNELTD